MGSPGLQEFDIKLIDTVDLEGGPGTFLLFNEFGQCVLQEFDIKLIDTVPHHELITVFRSSPSRGINCNSHHGADNLGVGKVGLPPLLVFVAHKYCEM